jgi:hypothetical protein
VTRPAQTGLVVCSIAAFCAVAALAQTGPDTFTATASVKSGSVQATADVRVEVHRYATDEERAALSKAGRESGEAVQKMLATMADAGFIQLAERRTPIKFARRRETPEGHLITVITAAPILFLGAGLPTAKPTTGFDVAVAILDTKTSASGMGELAPAAKIGVNEDGAVVIEDYGSTVVWLNQLARAR